MSGRSKPAAPAVASLVFLALCGTRSHAQSDWFPRAAAGPSARALHATALDPVRNQVLLFGGEVQGQRNDETWTWDGSAWSQRTPAAAPSARTAHAVAPLWGFGEYGALLFGGMTREGPDAETWAWNGASWIRSPQTVFAARHGHAMAVADEQGYRQVLCYGGLVGGQPTAETLTWTGSWLQRWSGPLPGARYAHAMAFDPIRNTTLMFGGLAAGGQLAVNDTWEWNRFTWFLRDSVVRPPARHGHAMAFEPVAGRIVMFGGTTASGPASDVWEWDGSNWQVRLPAQTPSARAGHAMATDPLRGRVFLSGGTDLSGARADTWAYGPMHLAQVAPFGPRCGPPLTSGPVAAMPWIGDIYRLRVENVDPNQAVFFLFGASDTAFGPLPLPLDLSPAGMPGCWLNVSADWIDWVLAFNSTFVAPAYVVPNSPSLIGATFFQQGLVVRPNANPLGVTATNGLRFVIGSH